jgi:hypothetical protein
VDHQEEIIYENSNLYEQGEYVDSRFQEEGVSTPGTQMPPAILTPPGMTSQSWSNFIEGQRLILNQLSSSQVGQSKSINTHQAGFQESGLHSSKQNRTTIQVKNSNN